MSDEYPTKLRIQAIGIVANSSARAQLSPEDRRVLEDAIEKDLDAADHRALEDHERVEKLEGQVHALSDAIVAIAEPSATVDGAVQTVKDKM
jgi:hypothetical protein